jgi:hypothetical protein
MTQTYCEVPGGAADAQTRPDPAERSTSTEPVSLAARLLGAGPSDWGALRARLLWGFGGLALLGAGPALGLYARGIDQRASHDLWWFAQSALSLPITAALSVALPLPGLLILLGMQGDRAELSACFHALSRAYYRLGLVAWGITPILVLYALTGARDGVLVVATLGYFLAGGVSLSLLLGDLYRCLSKGRRSSGCLLLGWACFVCLLSAYFFFKVQSFV